MLMDYPAKVTVKIDGMAASAASVIAMAGTQVLMAPTAMMMIHDPWTIAIGDSDEMKRAAAMLGEVKESIINAYEVRTKLPRQKLSNMMDAETWMSPRKAIELGFADGELEAWQPEAVPNDGITATVFSCRAVTNSILTKILQNAEAPPLPPAEPEEPTGTPVELLNKRLNLFAIQ
jgi:ATP-dependent Clp protease protease subunit